MSIGEVARHRSPADYAAIQSCILSRIAGLRDCCLLDEAQRWKLWAKHRATLVRRRRPR